MNIPEIAIGVASLAFVITQAHLFLTGRKLVRKSEESWARVDGTIAKVQTGFQGQIDTIRADLKSVGGEDLKRVIAEVDDLRIKLGGIPNFLEDRLLKVSANLSENFVLLQTAINQKIDSVVPKIPTFNPAVNLGDPREAQLVGATKKGAQKIVNAIDAKILETSMGGQVAALLDAMGEPGLKDWMQENPQAYPQILDLLQRNPRTNAMLQKMQGLIQGNAGRAGPHRSNGGEL